VDGAGGLEGGSNDLNLAREGELESETNELLKKNEKGVERVP